jgi:maltodextrin utilization protein YvdJ
MALSKEVMEADAAEKRVRDLKMTAIFKQKFTGKLLNKQQGEQNGIVEEAFSQVQAQRELADGHERAIYTLRADLENMKVCSSPRRPEREA